MLAWNECLLFYYTLFVGNVKRNLPFPRKIAGPSYRHTTPGSFEAKSVHVFFNDNVTNCNHDDNVRLLLLRRPKCLIPVVRKHPGNTCLNIENFHVKCLYGITNVDLTFDVWGVAVTRISSVITRYTFSRARIIILQLWMQRGKQNRIFVEPKFDGRGISSEAYNQLGRDPMGTPTVRAVGDWVRTGTVRSMRIVTSHVHRLQGNLLLTNYEISKHIRIYIYLFFYVYKRSDEFELCLFLD